MPLFIYKCSKCKKTMEWLLNKPTTTQICSDVRCKGVGHRVIEGSAAVHFKGTGWTPKHFI